MKKTTITFLVSCLLMVTELMAQSIQEGVNHLNSGRTKSAIGVFEKMLEVNPNSIEAAYWLGQSYLEMDEIAGTRIKKAKDLYQKTVQTSANAPLIMVGLGHVDLLENKTSDARQKFETALTMTKGKKGDDPDIVTAVARANVDAKSGDYHYAIQKIEAIIEKNEKNVDLLLQLGNAHRKAKPGEGGGEAYKAYKKILEINPAYSIANLRLAKLFESQKNWELVLQYLNDAVAKDPKFTIGYYELFYYYFLRGKFSEAEDELKKYIASKAPDTEIADEYLYAQLCWARKDFDCAITKAEAVVSALGENTKPKIYRLLADAALQKSDFQKAKKYSDLFFEKKNPEDVILPDFETRASILSKLNSGEEMIFKTYIDGVAIDTTEEAKVGFLKNASTYFKENKMRDKEAKIIQKIIEIKSKPIINDYFDLVLAYYFNQSHTKSRDVSLVIIQKFPDQVYGYDMAFKNAIVMDTVKKDSIAVPDALKLYEFAKSDTAKYRTNYINAVRFLAAYYINEAKDKEKSLEFFKKWQEVDAANAATIQGYIDQIEKMPDPKPSGQKGASSKPGGPSPGRKAP